MAFLARGDGLQIAIEPSRAVLALRTKESKWRPVAVEWAGANPRPLIRGEDRLPGESR
ncbi:MAG: hypothetical protein ACPL88_02410 [Bryobacteraceae bacterium]